MKRAALYARVSTEGQRDEQTIEAQIEEIKARIASDGNQLAEDRLYLDDGWTGSMLARPALDRLRDDAKHSAFDALYVYDRGRLARKFAYQEIVIEELTDLGIDFVTLHDVKAETPEEVVLQAMQGVFHEYERVKISERFRLGKMRKVRSGKLLGYNPKYGYDYHPRTKTSDGYFTINEVEAEVVRKIFDWFVNEELSIRVIRARLFELGIPPRKGKQSTWTTGPVVRLLQDESYTGTHYYNKTEAVMTKHPKETGRKYRRIKKGSKRWRPKEEWIPIQIPAIISRAMFKQAQKRFEFNKKFASNNTKGRYLLRGLVYCPCGQRRTGETSTGDRHRYYRCTDRIHRFPLPRVCDRPGVNGQVLDTIVWNGLVDWLSSPKLLDTQAQRWLEGHSAPRDYARIAKQVKDQLAVLQEQDDRYTLAYGEGVLPIDQYQKQLARLETDRANVRQQLVIHETDSTPNVDQTQLVSLAQQVISRLQFTDKQTVLRKLLDKVIADQDVVEVVGHLPLNESEVQSCYVGSNHADRNRWLAQRRKINLI